MKAQEYTEWRGEVINDVEHIRLVAKVHNRLTGQANKFPIHKAQKVSKLVDAISYQNIVYVTLDELKEVMCIPDKRNLFRALQTISDFVEVRTAGTHPEEVRPNYVKVVVNPAYGWRTSTRVSREKAINDWYMFCDLSETSKKDVTLSSLYQTLQSSSMQSMFHLL